MRRVPWVFWHCVNISHMIFLVHQDQCPDRTRQGIRTIETSNVANFMGLQHRYIFRPLNWEVGTQTFQNWKCKIIKWRFKKLQSGSKCGTRTVMLTNTFVWTYLQTSTESLDTMISEEPTMSPKVFRGSWLGGPWTSLNLIYELSQLYKFERVKYWNPIVSSLKPPSIKLLLDTLLMGPRSSYARWATESAGRQHL